MILRVEHTTEFGYDAPIAEAYTELRLRPLEGGGQHCSSFRLRTEPVGLRVREYTDYFGNDVLHFDVLESHDRLSVTAVSEVVTPPAFLGARDEPTPLELYDYLEPTDYAPFSESVAAFAGRHASGTGGRRQRRSRRCRSEDGRHQPGLYRNLISDRRTDRSNRRDAWKCSRAEFRRADDHRQLRSHVCCISSQPA